MTGCAELMNWMITDYGKINHSLIIKRQNEIPKWEVKKEYRV